MRNFILGMLCLLFVLLAVAYFLGQWMPNRRRALKYPVAGVDVSAHQGRVNWKSVAENGIRFAYIKATEGGDFQDAEFTENAHGAKEAGLACAAYHFFSLKTSGSIQAQNFIKTVPRKWLTLPPAVDLEFAGNSSARPSPEEFQEQFGLFMNAIRKEYGREPVIYASDDFANIYLKNCSIIRPWVRAVVFGPNNSGVNLWMFWQYSERGKVRGINGFVDLDVFNGDLEKLRLLSEENQP